jgi:heterodisulfide reductase subunit A
MGSEVILIEKQAEMGGHVSTYGPLFTTDQTGKALIDDLTKEIKSRANIKIFTHATLLDKKGSIGNFDIKVAVGDEIINLKTGSIIVNTGFDHYVPAENEYGYGNLNNVITLPEFKALVDNQEPGTLLYHGKKVRTIAYIYCVGS